MIQKIINLLIGIGGLYTGLQALKAFYKWLNERYPKPMQDLKSRLKVILNMLKNKLLDIAKKIF